MLESRSGASPVSNRLWPLSITSVAHSSSRVLLKSWAAELHSCIPSEALSEGNDLAMHAQLALRFSYARCLFVRSRCGSCVVICNWADDWVERWVFGPFCYDQCWDDRQEDCGGSCRMTATIVQMLLQRGRGGYVLQQDAVAGGSSAGEETVTLLGIEWVEKPHSGSARM